MKKKINYTKIFLNTIAIILLFYVLLTIFKQVSSTMNDLCKEYGYENYTVNVGTPLNPQSYCYKKIWINDTTGYIIDKRYLPNE